jgi:hypothetical protein
MNIYIRILEVAMSGTARVTVTLPVELVRSIDRFETNRSRFVSEAVENEINRRRRAGLLRSLTHPHPDSLVVAESGMGEWDSRLPDTDAGLVDNAAGTEVRWIDGRGWVEETP